VRGADSGAGHSGGDLQPLAGCAAERGDAKTPARELRRREDMHGAQERTRTFTAVKPLAPEASASTNSTTWAQGGLLRIVRVLVKSRINPPTTLFCGVTCAKTGPAFQIVPCTVPARWRIAKSAINR